MPEASQSQAFTFLVRDQRLGANVASAQGPTGFIGPSWLKNHESTLFKRGSSNFYSVRYKKTPYQHIFYFYGPNLFNPGLYKIPCLKNNKIYIGESSNVSNRYDMQMI